MDMNLSKPREMVRDREPGVRLSVGWQSTEHNVEIEEQVNRRERALLWRGEGLTFWHHV